MSALTTDSPADLDAMARGLGVLCIMDRTGDTRQMWDPNNADEVEIAKAAFEAAIAKGMRAYKVTKDGDKGELIKKFDPKAGKIILAPALVGG